MWLFHWQCMDTSIIDKLSEDMERILRRRYVLAWSPTDHLSTHHASIEKEHAKMTPLPINDDPPITDWSHAQKKTYYELAVKSGRWYGRWWSRLLCSTETSISDLKSYKHIHLDHNNDAEDDSSHSEESDTVVYQQWLHQSSALVTNHKKNPPSMT